VAITGWWIAFVAYRRGSDDPSMEYVNNFHDRRWVDDDTPGVKGYRYMEIVADDSEYTRILTVYDPPRVRE
jgi:hypothetical protein